MCVYFLLLWVCVHAWAPVCSVCHSGLGVAGACCILYSWMGTAWAWPAISPPTTRMHTQLRQLPLFLPASKNADVCVHVSVCVCVCIFRVNTNHRFLFFHLNIPLSLCVNVSLPLLLVLLHPPQGTVRTAAVPMTTSVLLSITKAALSSLAYILYMQHPQFWQVCRWHVTQLYSSQWQMHGTWPLHCY